MYIILWGWVCLISGRNYPIPIPEANKSLVRYRVVSRVNISWGLGCLNLARDERIRLSH